MQNKKDILGVWDPNKAPLNLGNLLIFAEELLIQKEIYEASRINITVYGKVDPKMLDIAYSLQYISEGNDQPPNYYILWPKAGYSYGTTAYITKEYKRTKEIPIVQFKKRILKKSAEFLKKSVYPKRAIAVHLKNNPAVKNCSNAVFTEWEKFFQKSEQFKDVCFLLIGDDQVSRNLSRLPNVISTRAFGLSLVEDLALISLSEMFMGCASGPCNAALFSRIPYIIYKDPAQHPEIMERELGDSDHFPFARPMQNIFRMKQSAEHMFSEFKKRYKQA